MFRFAYPWLFLLLLIPAALIFLDNIQDRRIYLKFPLESWIRRLFHAWDSRWAQFNTILLYLALVSLIIGLTRPQLISKETEIVSEGIDIILSVDASGSMAAMDFRLKGAPVNRLSVVKKVVKEFIRKQTGDRIGMVIFGDHAYTQSPSTLDYDVLVQLLDYIKVGIAGEGTAIGDGLALSVKRLKDLPGKSKVVVLLTDGRNNAGKISPEKAAEIAKTLGVKVYTIGIGTRGPVPFPQKGLFGTRLIYVDLDLDQGTLENIASITGGRYFYATDARKLENIYSEIGRLEKTEAKVKHYEHYDELYIYFALAGLVLLLLETLLSATLLRRLA